MMLSFLTFVLFSCVTAENARKSDTRTDLGTAYLKEGNAPGAVEALRQATTLNAQNATAWERLALAYMEYACMAWNGFYCEMAPI